MIKLIRILAFWAIIFNLQAKTYKYDVAICAIFQNEAPYLKEWLEYHQLLGVKKFYLYNHQSTDNYLEILKPYIKKKVVKLINWNLNASNIQEWNYIQNKAYMDCIAKIKNEVDWLAIIDIDEFLVLTQHNKLIDFLAPFFNVGGIAVHWQMFGTSNIQAIPSDKLLIETLTLKAREDYIENQNIKSIVRPRRVNYMNNPHYAEFLHPWFQVNSRYQRVGGQNNTIIDIEQIRINHYWSRDKSFFFNQKTKTRLFWGDSIETQLKRLNQLNEINDHTILRFAPALRSRMGLPPP